MRKYLTYTLVGFAVIILDFKAMAQGILEPSATLFEGSGKYRTWSLGVNAGALSPKVFIGGHYDYSNSETNLGYGLFVKKQLAPSFGIKANIMKGELSGHNKGLQKHKSFNTKIGYGVDLRGEVNVGTIDFLKKENFLAFTISAGYGVLAYAPKYIDDNNVLVDLQSASSSDYLKNGYVPIGLGAKFKVSNKVNFNIDYSFFFMEDDDLDANTSYPESKDKFSYAAVGLEFNFGKKSKPILLWNNPVVGLYNELNDLELRKDLEGLKLRIAEPEKELIDLVKDTDGDGVADYRDKCQNTSLGKVVDGAGCEIEIPGGK